LIYKALARPLLFMLPPEAAHRLAITALKLSRPVLPMARHKFTYRHPGLRTRVLGIDFPNPIGLAAGFDKYAECADLWPQLGFGFAELGTFTRHAQPGNPRPRVWRYPKLRAMVNRFGFNNPGAEAAAKRLRLLRSSGMWPLAPIGINLGKSKITPLEEAAEDYLFSLEKLAFAADYITINVSSPNTPGLRDLQNPPALKKLVAALVKKCRRIDGKKLPLLVKLAPDMQENEMRLSMDACLEGGAAGLIAVNTTLDKAVLGARAPEGGLSGAPLRERATRWVELLSQWTGKKVPIIAAGGIFTAADARQKLEAGASLVQLYTGFIYEGPGICRKICKSFVLWKKKQD
jgi:dihydroorotate dehydrogenase